MKNIFHINISFLMIFDFKQLCKKQSLILTAALILMFLTTFNIKVNAQVAAYTFSQSAGTYAALASPTNIHTTSASTWDDAVASVTIPFTFTFNGVGYTSCSVNTNGYITFGGTTSATNLYLPISDNTGYAGAVSALGMDLYSMATTGGNIVYQTLNSAPNRIFVIQWTNAYRYNIAGAWNFQIRLSETSNIINIVYGACAASNTNNTYTAQIGLRGDSNSDYNNRSLTANSAWLSNTTAGTANTNAVRSRNTALPASGTTFTWTPPAPCTGTPTAGTVTVSPTSGAPGSTYGVTANGYTTGTGLTYQWQYNDGLGWNNQGTATSSYAALTGLTAPALGTVRQWRLLVTCTPSAQSASTASPGSFTSTYCTSTSSSSTVYISSFSTTLGSTNITNNSSGYSTNGYSNTAQTVTQIQSSSINYSATIFNVAGAVSFGIFVDWNQDGDFADAGETAVSLGSSTQITTNPSGSFTVPATA